MAEEQAIAGTAEDSKTLKRPYKRATLDDARRWAEKYQNRASILAIAEQEGVAPSTVSAWLHKLGLDIKQGQHKVAQPPLKYPESFVELAARGPGEVLAYVRERVWSIRATEEGIAQMEKFCKFVTMHREARGVEEIARLLDVHRSTVAEWREGSDQPYIVKAAIAAMATPFWPEMKIVPLRVSSGGNLPSHWFHVPATVSKYEDFADVARRIRPHDEAFARASQFGIGQDHIVRLRPQLTGYALGMMVGDAGKLGGRQDRFKSMNVDIQFTQGEESNLRLGEFACMTFNLLGMSMRRIKDKPPSGGQLVGPRPTPAYRWTSNRSPIIAWIFRACLGLSFDENTSTTPVKMDWLFGAPYEFRQRFLQAMGDSDGTARRYVVEITSVPNAKFVTNLLKSVGCKTAHTRNEDGIPLRSILTNEEASSLPIFNEFVSGYRYERLMEFSAR